MKRRRKTYSPVLPTKWQTLIPPNRIPEIIQIVLTSALKLSGDKKRKLVIRKHATFKRTKESYVGEQLGNRKRPLNLGCPNTTPEEK